jgi:hypothetical protein
MRVIEPGREPDLPDESLGAQGVRQLGMEDLQGNRTVVPEIAGEKDRGHPAAPELAFDRVAVTQGVGQLGRDPLGQAWSCGAGGAANSDI